MVERFDVAIVGSGPAGSASALRLAHLGFHVALIDRRDFPRNKLCGEYLNCGAVRELDDLGVHGDLAGAAFLLRGMRLHAHGDYAEFHFPAEAWSLPRAYLDERLRSCAVSAGAVPIFGNVENISSDSSGVTLSLRSNNAELKIRSVYAIGADGMHSTVARGLGLRKRVRGSRYAVGGHYTASHLSGWLEMYVSVSGYVAINPLDEWSANVVFVLPREHLRRHRLDLDEELLRFSRAVTSGSRPFFGTQREGMRLAAGPLTYSARSLRRGNTILTGDAAGFVDPFTGQGVYLALAGARLAATALSQALHDRRTAPRALAAYASNLRRIVADRKRLAWMVASILKSRFLSRRAAAALRSRPHDYGMLVDAVSGKTTSLTMDQLAAGIARAFV